MDPVACLAEMRELREEIIQAVAIRLDNYDLCSATLRLCELQEALDDWMRSGGFSPWLGRGPAITFVQIGTSSPVDVTDVEG